MSRRILQCRLYLPLGTPCCDNGTRSSDSREKGISFINGNDEGSRVRFKKRPSEEEAPA